MDPIFDTLWSHKVNTSEEKKIALFKEWDEEMLQLYKHADLL